MRHGLRYDHAILDVCEALHGHVTGSGDALAPDVVADHVAWLSSRVMHWMPSANSYDTAVLALAMAAIAEAAGS